MAVTPRMSDADVDELLERGAHRELREAARAYRDEAILTLVELMEGAGVYSTGKTSKDGELLYYTVPPQVRRAAAKDLLELGHGKPGTQEIPKAAQGGVVINILRLGSGDGRAERAVELAAGVLEDAGVEEILGRVEAER